MQSKTLIKFVCIGVLSGSMSFLAGCTSRSSRAIEVEDGQVPQPVNPDVGEKPPVGEPTPSNTPSTVTPVDTGAGGQGEVPVELSAESIKAANYAINTDNLTYRFKYLTINKDGDIPFDANGKAQLKFSGLPTGQSADMTLELLEEGKVVLKGVAENVTLKAGANNNVKMTLKAVDNGGNDDTGNDDDSGDDTTDLTIDVTLDDAGSDDSGNDDSSNGGDDDDGGNDDTAGDPDPIAEWDGKSFKGNSNWKIVPANG